MNYIKHYTKLIRAAETRITLDGYTEKHHVFPVSLFGKNKRIVRLTAREHYVAHALLEKICLKRYGDKHRFYYKMSRAFFMMNITANGKTQPRYLNSRLYQYSKQRFIESNSGPNNFWFGKKRVFSESHLKRLQETRKVGKDSPFYGVPRSEEVKQKLRKPKHSGFGEIMSKVRQGIVFSDEHRKNLSKSHIGNVPGNKGKSKIFFKLTLPDSEPQIINRLELVKFAKDRKISVKRLCEAGTTTKKYKEFLIERLPKQDQIDE